MSEKTNRQERMLERQKRSVGGDSSKFKALNLPEGVGELKLNIEEMITLDIVPFLVDKKHPLYASIMKDYEEFGDRPDFWCLEYAVHKGIKGLGEVVCPKFTYGPQHRCPICEKKQEQQDATGVQWDDKSLEEFRYSKRVAYIVTKTEGEDDAFYVLSYPASWLHKDLDKKAKEQNVLLLDTSIEGKSMTLFPISNSFVDNNGKEHITPGKCAVNFVKRSYGYEEEDLALVPKLSSFLNCQTYEEIYTRLNGLSAPAETKAETPSTSVENGAAPVSRAAKRAAQVEVATPVTETVATPVADPPVASAGRRNRARVAEPVVAETVADEVDEIVNF